MVLQYWAAVVVASNYCLVITLYPAILMIHHRFIKKYEYCLLAYTCCICCTLVRVKKDDESSEPQDDDPATTPTVEMVRALSVNDGVGDGHEYRAMERFLGKTWSKWMDRTKIYNLIAFAILLIVTSCLALTQLKSEDDAGQLFKKSSWWYKLNAALRFVFQRSFFVLTWLTFVYFSEWRISRRRMMMD